jgi:3D (Asp-Asp-Asp) domain-containing protein
LIAVNARVATILVACAALGASACAARKPPASAPEPAMTFVATAYCHGTTTAAGIRVRPGIVAADPAVLPLGTVIRIERAGRYDGAYTVLDTGPAVRGRRVDVFMRDCREAVSFGRRTVRVVVERPSGNEP